VLLRGIPTNNIVQRMAAKQSFTGRFGRRRVEASLIPVKSHNPECAQIEQFAATLAPLKTYLVCIQDFDTKDYMLEFHGRSITITKEQFDSGTWQKIVTKALE
jgi:hypothetical protein